MARWSDISDSRGGGVDGVDGAHVEPGSVFPCDCAVDNAAICVTPKWQDRPRTWCSAGSWVTETSGGGEAIGHYGLLSCRWGICPNDRRFLGSSAPWQFLGYLRRSPCHILCLQEADWHLMIELTGLPNSKFIGIRTPEGYGWQNVICAQQDHVRQGRNEALQTPRSRRRRSQ